VLVDRYAPEDVFARVPELAADTDPVLVRLDRLLEDDELFARVRADLAGRYRLTACHGRHSTPAEAILRLLVVQHLYAWSYRETARRVADSLVLRWFCRVYFRRVPDPTTLLRWAQTIRPATLHALLDRVVALARRARVTRGRKLRIDGTVVPTAIHHPTDSSLLVDGVRVLSRAVRRSRPLVQGALNGARDAFRTRLRTARRALQLLHRMAGQRGDAADAARAAVYRRVIDAAERTVGQAEVVRAALADAVARNDRTAGRLAARLDRFLPLVRRVVDQARRRVLLGQQVPAPEKVLSLFEPHTRLITRRKPGAAVEFGRTLVLDEVEGGIVTRYRLLAAGAAEQAQLGPALRHHRALFGRAPRLVTGDRRLHGPDNERLGREAGVVHLVIPRSGVVGPPQRARERSRPWRRRYRWRSGIEGRISSLRRDYGLRRCADHGEAGMERCVGWAIMARNRRHIALKLAA
jgi:transposase, IS5 family